MVKGRLAAERPAFHAVTGAEEADRTLAAVEKWKGSNSDIVLTHLQTASLLNLCTFGTGLRMGKDKLKYCKHCKENYKCSPMMHAWCCDDFRLADEGFCAILLPREASGLLKAVESDAPVVTELLYSFLEADGANDIWKVVRRRQVEREDLDLDKTEADRILGLLDTVPDHKILLAQRAI